MAIVVWRALRAWWRARQRKLDVEILWPQLCLAADDLENAKRAFAWHACTDPAWLELGPDEIRRQVQSLSSPRR